VVILQLPLRLNLRRPVLMVHGHEAFGLRAAF
jgi:hypothetical protein